MSKYDLSFANPIMNAAGILGFAPDPHAPVDFGQFGAFVTNPISLEPRSPAFGQRCLPFPGGLLVHTGYPNPGFRSVLRSFRERWARSQLPVVIHLLAVSPSDIAWMVERLEGLDGISGVEIGIPPGAVSEEVANYISAAAGELPVIVRLPLEQAVLLAPVADSAGAAAISLGAPRGSLPDRDGKTMQGRLYGPAQFPQALAAVQNLARQGLKIIGAGGIYSRKDAEVMLISGATAVQLDTVLWRDGWE